MNKRSRILAMIAIIIAIIGILIVSQISTSFHIENRNVSDEKYEIWIIDIENCNVSVSFANDTHLFYAFDVKLSSVAFGSSSYSVEVRKTEKQVIFRGTTSVVSVDVTLGTAMQYDIWVRGENLDTTITYSNGALIDDTKVYFVHSGSCRFNLNEDVIANGNLDVSIRNSMLGSSIELIFIDINLPAGMNGVMNFDSESDVSIHDNIGWYRQIPPLDRIEYSTDPNEPPPLLSILAGAGVENPTVHAWLST